MNSRQWELHKCMRTFPKLLQIATCHVLLIFLVNGTCRTSDGWIASGISSCLLFSTLLNGSQGQVKLTWDDAKDACMSLNPWSSLASLPTDEHHRTIAHEARDGHAYWVGIRVMDNDTKPYTWLDGTPENRQPVFPGMPSVPSHGSPYFCGEMKMTSTPNQHKQLEWMLVECQATEYYICLMDQSKSQATLRTKTSPGQQSKVTSNPTKPNGLESTTTQGALPYSSEATRLIRQLFRCTLKNVLDCLTQPKDLTAWNNQRLLLLKKSASVLFDEMIRNVKITPKSQQMQLLKDYLSALDKYIAMWSRNGRGPLSQDTLDLLIHKVECFIDALAFGIGLNLNTSEHITYAMKYVEMWTYNISMSTLPNVTITTTTGTIRIVSPTSDTSHYSSDVDVSVFVLVMDVVPGSKATFDRSKENKYIVRSPILSLSAYTQDVKLSLVHTFTFDVINNDDVIINDVNATTAWQIPNTSQPICVSSVGNHRNSVWSSQGCEVTYINQSEQFPARRNALGSQSPSSILLGTPFINQVQCWCNHTTSFAILMSVVDVELFQVDVLALDIITYLGCGITVVTTLIAITVFTCIKSLNSEKVCVHRNLCIAILVSQIIFLVGIQAVENKTICGIVALLLHYFYMATFVWMLVEGLHLYSKVVRVFGTEKTRIVYYYCFGWGLPLLEVAVSAAIDWDGYGTDRSCWLSIDRGTIWAFVAPALSILFVNYVILFVVLKIVMLAARVESPDDYVQVRAGVKASLFLSPLLGLTWIFGLVAVNHNMIVFQYMFSIFNSLQGFFIFLYHCILNTDVRETLKRIHGKILVQKEIGNSRTGSAGSSYSDTRTIVTQKEFISPVFRRTSNRITPENDSQNAKEQNEQPQPESEQLTLIHI